MKSPRDHALALLKKAANDLVAALEVHQVISAIVGRSKVEENRP